MSLKSNYRDGDSFSRKSKEEGYRSRASYKLKQILEKELKLSKDQSVFDLGSFPGGWSQVISNKLGKGGKLAAMDIQPMEPIRDCFFLQKPIEDLCNEDLEEIKEFLPFDLVLSDMAPNISGIKEKDEAQMIELIEIIKSVSDEFLSNKGGLLVKVFHGEPHEKLMNYVKSNFQQVRIRKPSASRPNSSELYVLAIGKNYE